MYSYQLYISSSLRKLKTLDSIHEEGIRIYTGIFRSSTVKSLNIKSYDPSLEIRWNKLGLRFLYKLRSKPHIHNL